MAFNFSLGKAKQPEPERSVESETIERWRKLARENTKTADIPWPDDEDEEAAQLEANEFTFAAEEHEEEGVIRLPRASGTSSLAKAPATSDDMKRQVGENVRSALGPGTVIEGKLSFDSPVRIDGTLTGEVTSTSMLIVGEEAVIEGTLHVGSLIVMGQVTGDVQAPDLLHIKTGGRLRGDIRTERLVVDDGGFFQGGCNIS